MNETVQEFLESHIELIDQNKFAELYIRATTRWTFPNNRNISLVTETLLDAGINPLEYMDYIPLCMFWESNIKEIDIPETITFIENDAFHGCQYLEDITIPASCDHVGPNAFSACSKLITMTILNPNCEFDQDTLYAFGTSNIKRIIYNGTIKQFRQRYKDIKLPYRFILQATDGNIFMEV